MLSTAVIVSQLKSEKVKKVTIEIICFLFILLFTYAALTKLAAFERSVVQIATSPVLGPLTNYAGYISWLIPSIELLVAAMLAIPKFRQIGLYTSFSLMIMFTAYIIAILQFSDQIPCSCGGVLSSLGWSEHLIFNVFFILLGLIGILLNSKKNSIRSLT